MGAPGIPALLSLTMFRLSLASLAGEADTSGGRREQDGAGKEVQ